MSSIDFSGFNFAGDHNIKQGMFSKINLEQIIEKANKVELEKLQKLEVEKTNKKNLVQSLNKLQTYLTNIKTLINNQDEINVLFKKKAYINPPNFIDVDITNYKDSTTNFIIEDVIKGENFTASSVSFTDFTEALNHNARITISINGTTYKSEFDVGATDSYEDIAKKINQSKFLEASIIKTEESSISTTYKMLVRCLQIGQVNENLNKINIYSSNNGYESSLIFSKIPIRSHQSNTLEPLPGFKITILDSYNINSIHVTIAPDKDATIKLLDKFVSLYKELQDFIILNKIKNPNISVEKTPISENETFRKFVAAFETLFLSYRHQSSDKTLSDIGFVMTPDGYIEIKNDIFLDNLDSNKIVLIDFFKHLTTMIDGFNAYRGPIKQEIDATTKSIESTIQDKAILNTKIQNKKRELAQKFSSLEGKIVQSEQLIKMMEIYAKQIAK